MVDLFKINLSDQLDRLDSLHFWFQICMHFFLTSCLKTNIEVWFVGYHAFDELSILTLEEAENCHPIFILMETIFEWFCFKVGEETNKLFVSLIEFDANLFLELLSLVLGLLSHFPPIIMKVFYY